MTNESKYDENFANDPKYWADLEKKLEEGKKKPQVFDINVVFKIRAEGVFPKGAEDIENQMENYLIERGVPRDIVNESYISWRISGDLEPRKKPEDVKFKKEQS